jgi:mRNA interferase YafQ
MYEIKRSKKFKKSYKKMLKSGDFPIEDFNNIVFLLSRGKELPAHYHNHILQGDFSGLFECHVESDCLLIYEMDHIDKSIRFINIGNHANLFGM